MVREISEDDPIGEIAYFLLCYLPRASGDGARTSELSSALPTGDSLFILSKPEV